MLKLNMDHFRVRGQTSCFVMRLNGKEKIKINPYGCITSEDGN